MRCELAIEGVHFYAHKKGRQTSRLHGSPFAIVTQTDGDTYCQEARLGVSPLDAGDAGHENRLAAAQLVPARREAR